MGNCLMVLGLKKLKRPVTLLLVGLDNAGKTTAAKGIIGDSIENVAPTVGFSPETLEYRGCQITIYDLGGGSRIRAVWPRYFSEIHGVIFVIDSSDKERIEECRGVLEELLSHRKVSGKPVLVLANKQDIDGALDEIDLVESLKIEQVVNNYKCPTRVETCSAVAIHKRKPDKPIADGFRWLIDTIVIHYQSLQKRVQEDTKEEQEKLQLEMERRKERLKVLREEREKKERMEELAHQQGRVNDSDDDAIMVKPIAPDSDLLQDLSEGEDHIMTLNKDQHLEPTDPMNFSSAKHEAPDSLTSSGDGKELRELGFGSSDSLTSTSSSCASFSTQRAVCSNTASNGHKSPRLIEVHPPPADLDQSTASPEAADPSVNKSPPFESHPEVNLEDSLPRSTECVPIDSEDEIFQSVNENEMEGHVGNSAAHRTVANGSAIAGIKEQIELEASLHRKPKRKSFLKRLHKTAPMTLSSVSSEIMTSEENANQTQSGRIP